MIRQAGTVKGVTITDLYQRYPDFDIDIDKEQKLLLQHDVIIWQHPFYWYSVPPLMKQWFDLVLEHGWAYGKKGRALEGKKIFNAFSSGGGTEGYSTGGFNKYPIHDFLKAFERTAELCRTTYWPPFWVPGVHRMEEAMIRLYAQQYQNLLTAISTDLFSEEEISTQSLMNDLFPINSTRP